MDWHSNYYCHWNAESWHGWGCCMCTKVCINIMNLLPCTSWLFSLLAAVGLSTLPLHLWLQWSRGQTFANAGLSQVHYEIVWFLFCSDFILIVSQFSSLCNFYRTPEEVLAAKGVKPTLSPNLNTLALIEVCKKSGCHTYLCFLISASWSAKQSFRCGHTVSLRNLITSMISCFGTGCWGKTPSLLWCGLPGARYLISASRIVQVG